MWRMWHMMICYNILYYDVILTDTMFLRFPGAHTWDVIFRYGYVDERYFDISIGLFESDIRYIARQIRANLSCTFHKACQFFCWNNGLSLDTRGFHSSSLLGSIGSELCFSYISRVKNVRHVKNVRRVKNVIHVKNVVA